MKKCFKCGGVKAISEFYRHPRTADGRLNKCKDCAKRDALGHRAANLKRYQEYDRKRNASPKRREDILKQSKAHPQWKKKADEKYLKDSVRAKANRAVGNAVRDGRLTKEPCEVCGQIRSQAHHDDYAKPLGVRWLCVKRHTEHHNRLREEARAAVG